MLFVENYKSSYPYNSSKTTQIHNNRVYKHFVTKSKSGIKEEDEMTTKFM